MMRELPWILCAVLLGGCPDVVSVDDPRTIDDGYGSNGSGTEAGRCTGSPVFCDERTLAQCNSGCTVKPTCHSEYLERCASLRDPDACDADSYCHWQLDVCKSDIGGCGIYESQTACTGGSLDGCVWGNSCTGQRTYCFEIETSAACIANLGCTWLPE